MNKQRVIANIKAYTVCIIIVIALFADTHPIGCLITVGIVLALSTFIEHKLTR